MIIDHRPKKEKTHVTDSYMLKFIEQKLGIPQTYGNMEIEDELSYFEHLYQHLKEVWYGLMISQARESSRNILKIDNFIKKYQLEWNEQLLGSIFYDQNNPYDEKDPNRKYGSYRIVKIGEFTI